MTVLSRDERNLIIIQGLDYFASGLAWIFVTIFLFAHSDLRTTIFFQLWSFISLLVFVVSSGWILRKISSGLMMKIGIACGALFYFLLFLLQGKTVQYLIPLAIFSGFGSAMFWMSFNYNQYIFSNSGSREHYFGYANAVISFLSAIAPFLGGAIITVAGTTLYFGISAGYAILFLFVSLLLFSIVLFIGKLPSHETQLFFYHDLFTKNHSIAWRLVLWQQAFLGLYDTALGTVTGILFYLIIRQELWIGVAQSAGYLLGTIGGIASAKLLGKRPWLFWVGSIGLSLGILIFAYAQNLIGLWLFVIVSGFTIPFLNTSISTMMFQAMDAVGEHWRHKYHFLLERDIVLGILRVVSYLFLYIYLSYGDQVTLAKQWLYILPILPLSIGILLHFSGKVTSR